MPRLDDTRLMDFARRHKPLIVVDSFIRFLIETGGCENSAEDIARMNSQLLDLCATGATILVVHHRSDKVGANRYRGSSDLLAGSDMFWIADRPSKDDTFVSFEAEKSRHAREFKFGCRMDDGIWVPAEEPINYVAAGGIARAESPGRKQ